MPVVYLTDDEVRDLAAGEPPDSMVTKAQRFAAGLAPAVVAGQTDVFDHLPERPKRDPICAQCGEPIDGGQLCADCEHEEARWQ